MSGEGYWQSLAEEEKDEVNLRIPDNREKASQYERMLLIESDSLPARIFNNIMSILISIVFVLAIVYYAICVIAALPGTIGSLYIGGFYASILGGGSIMTVLLWIIHAAIGFSIFPMLEDADVY